MMDINEKRVEHKTHDSLFFLLTLTFPKINFAGKVEMFA